MDQKYYVGSLSFNTDEQSLKKYFSSFGDIISVDVIRDKLTGRNKGFGFITVRDGLDIPSDGDYELDGRRMFIDKAQPRPERPKSNRSGFDRPISDNPNNEGSTEESSQSILEINKKISLELYALLRANPPFIYSLSPRKFEELIAQVIEDFGYLVELTPETHDGGKDIIASVPGNPKSTFYVECKRYSLDNLVNISIIHQFHSVLTLDKVSNGIVATSSYFTRDSQKLVKRIENTGIAINLQDFDGVFNWIDIYIDRRKNSDCAFLSYPIVTIF